MGNIFDYDWFKGPSFEQQKHEARQRCAQKKFPDLSAEQAASDPSYQSFLDELEVRVLIYLRDGFSYEMKELVNLGSVSSLTFECEPLDEHYKVGAFVVSLPFEEIVRIEIFAVHPSQKPEDMPLITGFRMSPSELGPSREEPSTRDEA